MEAWFEGALKHSDHLRPAGHGVKVRPGWGPSECRWEPRRRPQSPCPRLPLTGVYVRDIHYTGRGICL
jgi:hypothetical protein